VRSNRTRLYMLLAAACVLVSGCGGTQNVFHFSSPNIAVVNGIWDGVWLYINIVWTIVAPYVHLIIHGFNPNKYGIISHHHPAGYLLGYAIGLILLGWFTGWGWRRRGRIVGAGVSVRRVRRTY